MHPVLFGIMTPFPLILGHRGASAVAPENTLVAFSRAISDGADGIEFDVRLSRDQVPVVIHDLSLKRTGTLDKLVSQLTAKELGEIDVGRWFAGRSETSPTPYAGERLPLLAQVFELFSETNGVLYVEMKCEPSEGSALAAEVVLLTREYNMVERVVVESFDLRAVAAIKKADASIRTAALFEPRLSNPIASVRGLKIIELARECGADEIALHYSIATTRTIQNADAVGLATVVWTVDDPQWVSKACALGIKALISNDPARLVRHRDELQSCSR